MICRRSPRISWLLVRPRIAICLTPPVSTLHKMHHLLILFNIAIQKVVFLLRFYLFLYRSYFAARFPQELLIPVNSLFVLACREDDMRADRVSRRLRVAAVAIGFVLASWTAAG